MEGIAPVQPPNVEETCDSIKHPLENTVVLKRLFELIPFELKKFQSFRLVSRTWHKVSLSSWRKTAAIILHDKDRIDEQDDKSVTDDSEDDEKESISWQKYLELLENDEYELVQHPFRKYSLRSCKIGLESVNEDGDQGQLHFWNKVGPLMTHLTLNTCEFVAVADFRRVLFEKTPNLQSLAMYENTYPNEKPATKAQRLDPQLPQHALIPPDQVQNNLKEFDVKFICDDSEDEDTDEDQNEDTDEDQNEDTDEDQNEVADEDDNEVVGEDVDEVVDTSPNPTGSQFPITWMEFLIHFPNIKKLGGITLWVGSFRLGTEADFLEFFETVEILRREHGSRYLADLTDLNLLQTLKSRGFGQQLFSTINRLNFPFQKLSFGFDLTVEEETFKQLLQNPLKYLDMEQKTYGNYGVVRPFRNFPFGLNLAALTELGLWGPIAPNLVFLKECPNLETFSYIPFSGDRLDDFNLIEGLGDISMKLEKLKSLAMYCDRCNAEEIRKLGELMPNVTGLEVGLDDESFRAVCEVWKELESLNVDPCRVGEDALLGKDKQGGENFRHPNLTDLKNLEAFFMEPCEDDQQGFTDAMILDGILALPKLEKVNLLISSEVSSRVLNQLKMAIPKCYITTQTGAPRAGDEFAMAAAQFQQNRTDTP